MPLETANGETPPPQRLDKELTRFMRDRGQTMDSALLKVLEKRNRMVAQFLADISFDPATHVLVSVPGDRLDLFVEVLICLPQERAERLQGATLDLRAARALAESYPSLGIVLPRG